MMTKNGRSKIGHEQIVEMIGPGDVLTITIWEADQTGVFASTSTADRNTIPMSR
jgi:hypothetical protein